MGTSVARRSQAHARAIVHVSVVNKGTLVGACSTIAGIGNIMNTRLTRLTASVSLSFALLACSHQVRLAPTASAPPTSARLEWQTPASELASGSAGFSSVNEYKLLAAKHVMRYNSAHTFSDKLPPMLAAVVVLSITVDEYGALTEVLVQRPPARDDGESDIAVASVRRVGTMPRPFNLANGSGQTLTYSETFLFNADRRFQIRTLAPVQTAD